MDQPRDLREAHARHPDDLGPNSSAFLLALRGIFLRHQNPLNPAVKFGAVWAAEFDSFAASQELLNQFPRQCFGVLHAYLQPGAECLTILHSQDHLVLESTPVSGSSCIGQFSRTMPAPLRV